MNRKYISIILIVLFSTALIISYFPFFHTCNKFYISNSISQNINLLSFNSKQKIKTQYCIPCNWLRYSKLLFGILLFFYFILTYYYIVILFKTEFIPDILYKICYKRGPPSHTTIYFGYSSF